MNDGGLILVLVPVLCVFVSTAVVLLYRGHESRLVMLETWMRNTVDTRLRELETASTAAVYTTAALNDFRAETRREFVEMRAETKEKREEQRHEFKNYRTETAVRLETMSKETREAINALTLQVAGLTTTILHREPPP